MSLTLLLLLVFGPIQERGELGSANKARSARGFTVNLVNMEYLKIISILDKRHLRTNLFDEFTKQTVPLLSYF